MFTLNCIECTLILHKYVLRDQVKLDQYPIHSLLCFESTSATENRPKTMQLNEH